MDFYTEIHAPCKIVAGRKIKGDKMNWEKSEQCEFPSCFLVYPNLFSFMCVVHKRILK